MANFMRRFETLNGKPTPCKACKATCQRSWSAAAAFLAGLYVERLRAELARQAWQKKGWNR